MNYCFRRFLIALGWQRITLVLIIGSLIFLRSSEQSLAALDEGYYSLQARWIVESGNWIAPQWWGEPQYDRTIGIQWAIALSYKLFGISEISARLPSNLACVLGVLLTYEISSILINKQVAWLAALILSLTPLWILHGLLAAQDTTLVFIELLGIWALLQAEQQLSHRQYWGIIAGSTFGLGFLIKGFMIFLPCVALLPYLIGEHRRHRHFLNPGIYLGFILGIIPVITWLGLSWLQYGWQPFQELFGKLFTLGKKGWFQTGPEYYFWNIPANAFPWPLFTLIGVRLTFINLNNQRKLLLLGYPIFLFLELTLFKTRTPYYALQLMPFMAMFAGSAFVWLTQLYSQGKNKKLITILSLGFGGLGILLIIFSVIISTNLIDITTFYALQQYSILAFFLGISWLMLLVTRLSNPSGKKWRFQAKVWLFSWFIGPWIVLQGLNLTGLLGNHSPEIKAFFKNPEIDRIAQNQKISFVAPSRINDIFTGLREFNLNSSEYNFGDIHSNFVLLSFYTPNLGKNLSSLSALSESGSQYAFVSPNISIDSLKNEQKIANIRSWTLIKVEE